jgi:hypothetical protein
MRDIICQKSKIVAEAGGSNEEVEVTHYLPLDILL